MRTRQMDFRDRAFNSLNYILLTLLAVAMVYPFVYVLSASISSPPRVLAGDVLLWPRDVQLDAYAIIAQYDLFWIAYRNTVFYTSVGTFLNVVLTVLAAYPLSRRWFFGRGPVQFFIVFTMLFSGGLIPYYLVVRDLQLLDTPWAMIVPGAVSAWNLIITRTYFEANLPDELVEAAEIDGASDLRIVSQIVLPLSMPVIAVITLFYAVGHWNEFFTALIFLQTRTLEPLQVILREILISQTMQDVLGDVAGNRAEIAVTVQYASIIVATAPILLLYPFLQRYFVKGMMIGALKS